MSAYGFVKMAAASPKIKVANPVYNGAEILSLIRKADERGAATVVFPELSLTGYTCGDLFFQQQLLETSQHVLKELLQQTREFSVLVLLGMPIMFKDRLYNCAVVFQKGKILGVVPKMHLPNYKEFYEKRWFNSGLLISKEVEEIRLCGEMVSFGRLLFKSQNPSFTLGIEICEDLWTPIPPSSLMVLQGADIIANLSAGNELVAKSDYRKSLVLQQSARGICGYLYSSAGVHESTTDLVFGGECLFAENGVLLAASSRFQRDNQLIFVDIDTERLRSERLINKTFADNADNMESFLTHNRFKEIEIKYSEEYSSAEENFDRKIAKNPFVPQDPATMSERCREIFSIQVAGLAKRIEHTKSKCAVIGVSGGLDSTLALLVTRQTFELLGMQPEQILAYTMPGFGTTDETYNNALALMKLLSVSVKEIDIKDACLQHFKDIGHDETIKDVTYENVQARERTQILMDIANKQRGLVVGTGDLSELALGWATYNGDHMSMYGVNCGIPKTLVKFLVRWAADHTVSSSAKEVLYRIIETPISPELLPPDEGGAIAQKTEEIVGPYELHDFFLFYTLRYGMKPAKILFLANRAYEGTYSEEELKKWLRVFYQRFFNSQFKRSCLPDGPKVGSVSLSPRGDWRMPSDADAAIWLKDFQ